MSNDSKNGNIYALEVNPKIITIEPNSSIQLQIITQVEYDYKIQPEGYITYDIKSNTITGVREGIGSIEIFTFTKQEVLDDSEYEDENKTMLKPLQKDEYGNDIPRKTNTIITKKDGRIIQVEVVKNVKQRRPRIMFHNRGTNQLTTIEIDPNTDNNVVFDLPIEDGILASTNTRANPAIITTPYIVTPEAKITLEHEGYLEFSKYHSINNDKYKHKRTIVQYSRNSTFTDLLCEETFETNNLTKAGCKYFGIGVYVRFKYCTIENIESEWSEYKYYEYRINTKEGGRNEVVVGDIKTSGYFGVIPKDTYVENRLMCGDLHIRVLNFTSGVLFSMPGNVYWYKNKYYMTKHDKSEQNFYNNVIKPTGIDGFATENQTCEKFLNYYQGVWPDLDPNDFEEDTREGLSTPRHLIKHTLGCMWKHKNDDKWVRWNNNYWLKFIINGKILYITHKPVYKYINWDEIAKYDLVYGNKTVKMGSNMYKIRLPREEEFREMIRLSNEYKKIAPVDEPAFFSPENRTLIEDFYVYHEPADKTKRDNDIEKRYSRKVIDNDGVVKLAPQNAIEVFEISYMPVLELIQPYDEPHNHFPLTTFNPDGFLPYDYKKPDNDSYPYPIEPDMNEFGYQCYFEIYRPEDTGSGEAFIYDPLYDRGIFVPLHEGKHIWSTDKIVTLMGIQQSEKYVDTLCSRYGLWYKFYFRGQILFVTPSRRCISPADNFKNMKNNGEFYYYKNYIKVSNTCLDTKADYFKDIKRYVTYKDYVYALLIKNNITHIAKDELYENKEEVKTLLEKNADREDIFNINYELLNSDEKYELNIPEKNTVHFISPIAMTYKPDIGEILFSNNILDNENANNGKQLPYCVYLAIYGSFASNLISLTRYSCGRIKLGTIVGLFRMFFVYNQYYLANIRELLYNNKSLPSTGYFIDIFNPMPINTNNTGYNFSYDIASFSKNLYSKNINILDYNIMYHLVFNLIMVTDNWGGYMDDYYFHTLYHNTIPYIYKRNEELEFITNS